MRQYKWLATALAFLGITIYIASNMVVSMVSLSNQYAHVISDMQTAMLLAADQAMLAIFNGSGIDVCLIIFMVIIQIFSVIMLRNKSFNHTITYMGILVSIVALAYYILLAFTSVAFFIFEAAGLIFVVWLIFVGRHLVQFGYG
jgi:hypothetical protein